MSCQVLVRTVRTTGWGSEGPPYQIPVGELLRVWNGSRAPHSTWGAVAVPSSDLAFNIPKEFKQPTTICWALQGHGASVEPEIHLLR